MNAVTRKLMTQYLQIMHEHGPDSREAVDFAAQHQDNERFAMLVRISGKLKQAIDDYEDWEPLDPRTVTYNEEQTKHVMSRLEEAKITSQRDEKMMKEWIDREHPSGSIDWRKEFERLLNVVEQALPTLTLNSAAEKLLAIAARTGNAMLRHADYKILTAATGYTVLRNDTVAGSIRPGEPLASLTRITGMDENAIMTLLNCRPVVHGGATYRLEPDPT